MKEVSSPILTILFHHLSMDIYSQNGVISFLNSVGLSFPLFRETFFGFVVFTFHNIVCLIILIMLSLKWLGFINYHWLNYTNLF